MQDQERVTQESRTRGEGEKQFLTFTLGDEHYGVEILKVQEIRGLSAITAIPNTPREVKGVMNLRGTIIPVVDLRGKFGMPEAEYTSFTVIIVLHVANKTVGLIVDGVSDVLDVPLGDFQETPDLGNRTDTRFISGMAKAGERLVVFLDTDTLLADETAAIEAAA